MNFKNYKSHKSSVLILLSFCFLIFACSKIEVKSSQPTPDVKSGCSTLGKGESATQLTNDNSVAEIKNPPTPFKKGGLSKEKVVNQILLKQVNQQNLSVAYNKFGCLLFNEVFESGKNCFVSPISISLALAMTYNGAENKTKEEMASVLNISDFEISAFNKENEKIITLLTSNKDSLKLSIANSLWAKKEEPFKKPFLNIARTFYQAEIENVNFLAPETVLRINDWVEKKTQDKIKNLLSKNDVNRDTLLVLINAIYFKGEWKEAFKEPLTKDRDFYFSDGTVKKIPLMSKSGVFLYFGSTEYQAVQLPYSDEKLKMVIFLPGKDSSLKKFLENFSEEKLKKMMAKFRKENGTVLMPRFKMEFEIELKKVLSKLGMPTAFNRRTANFRKMCELKPDENISIDKVKHKAFIEVNEKGTEAAAATAITMIKTTSMSPRRAFQMNINRPFFFTIFDSESRAILFMGTVEKP